jgi:gliding motility-associated-like protein
VGPNSSLLSEGPTNWSGDPDLQQAINENNTINATVIEFDFLPFANKISFEYIFSSEQYLSNPNPNQCNFSDGFAFLLREASSTQYTNLAVVPGTTIPVKIPTVRGSGTICQPANEEFFDAFNGIEHPTNFNGQTKILKAESNVTPGVLYHIKLVIADQGNNLYDSAIFLGGGSFNVETDLGPNRLISTENPLCENETLQLDATTPNATNYKWFRNNQLIVGEINPTFTVTEFGFYSVEVEFNGDCFSTGEILIEYTQNPIPNATILTQCDDNNDGIAFFNLLDANTTIAGTNPNIIQTKFFLNQTDAFLNQNAILNVTQFQNTIPNQILHVRLENIFGCFGLSTLALNTAINNLILPAISICDEDETSDGVTTFGLNTAVTPILSPLFDFGSQLTYYANVSDAQLQQNALLTTFTNTTPFQQMIFVRVSNGASCVGIFPLNMEIITFTPEGMEDETLILCQGNSLTIGINAPFEAYEWNTGETTPFISINAAGIFTLRITNSNGCTATKNFTIILSSPPIIESISVNDFLGNQNSITVLDDGIGEYIYSLDGFYFQDSPIFYQVAPGDYLVTVKDQNGCGIATAEIIVLDYPKFFTPNGDGINDFWRINNLIDPDANVTIFNRYGQLLVQFNPSLKGWDGNFNNSTLPSTDYWFILTLSDRRIIKGHFSLKR